MSKEIFKDTIGQCQLYSNPYDPQLQSNPRLVRHRQDTYAQVKDTLSPMQSRMEKEILLKILAGNFTLGMKKFLLIGKYTFLALVLPPYMFFYGIPKWAVVKALPKLQRAAEKICLKIFKEISDAAKSGFNLAKNTARKLTHPIFVFIQKRTMEAGEHFAGVRDRIITSLNYPLQKMSKRFADLIGKLGLRYQNIAQSWVRSNLTVRKKLSLPFDKVSLILNGLSNKFKTLKNRLNKPFSLFVNRFHLLIQESKKLFLAGRKTVKTTTSTTKSSLIDVPLRRLQSLFKKARENSTELLEKMNPPIKRHLDPFVQEIKKISSWTLERLEKTKEKITEKTKEILDLMAKQTISIANAANGWIPTPVVSFFSPVIGLFYHQHSHIRKQTRLKVFVKKIAEKIHSGLQNSAKWSKRALAFVAKWLLRLVGKLSAVPTALFQKLKQFYLLLKKCFMTILTALKGAFLLLRLMTAWTAAFLRYGLIVLEGVWKI